MEEQKVRQQAMVRNMDPNDDPELTRALKALKEEHRTRQQVEGREEQDAAADPEIRSSLAEEETKEEAPPQRAPAPAMA